MGGAGAFGAFVTTTPGTGMEPPTPSTARGLGWLARPLPSCSRPLPRASVAGLLRGRLSFVFFLGGHQALKGRGWGVTTAASPGSA